MWDASTGAALTTLFGILPETPGSATDNDHSGRRPRGQSPNPIRCTTRGSLGMTRRSPGQARAPHRRSTQSFQQRRMIIHRHHPRSALNVFLEGPHGGLLPAALGARSSHVVLLWAVGGPTSREMVPQLYQGPAEEVRFRRSARNSGSPSRDARHSQPHDRLSFWGTFNLNYPPTLRGRELVNKADLAWLRRKRGHSTVVTEQERVRLAHRGTPDFAC